MLLFVLSIMEHGMEQTETKLFEKKRKLLCVRPFFLNSKEINDIPFCFLAIHIQLASCRAHNAIVCVLLLWQAATKKRAKCTRMDNVT
jgi:hypothetical protein